MSELPLDLAECDRQIQDYRIILRQVSQGGRVAVWEQIDRLLERRLELFLGLSVNSQVPQYPS